LFLKENNYLCAPASAWKIEKRHFFDFDLFRKANSDLPKILVREVKIKIKVSINDVWVLK